MKELDKLIEISRKYGADPSMVIAGGGNTSFKTADRLWVKASGHALATIGEDGFAVLDRALLNPMGEKRYSSDAAERESQVKDDLAAACITKDRRPSVETSLHNCLEAKYVVHLHPTLVNALMCSVDAAGACARLFPDALYIPYTDPGYTLFKKVYGEVKAYRKRFGKEPSVIFLQNHGIFVGADSTGVIEKIYDGVISTIRKALKASPASEEPAPAFTQAEICGIIPAIRSILSRSGRGLKTLKITLSSLVDGFVSSSEAVKAVLKPFTPDGIVYCKSEYIYLDADTPATLIGQAEKKIEAYVAKRGYTPKVLLIKGIGLVAVGSSPKEARTVTDVFTDAMEVAFHSACFGGPHPMTPRLVAFIDNWEVENYRRKVSATVSSGRMEGRTVIVTGAAQGFGEGIARNLLKEGANIVVADLNEEGGKATADRFCSLSGAGRAVFVKADVSNLESLENLVFQSVLTYGAIDLLVANAGVVRAGSLEEMTERNFNFVTDIDYKGYFLCAKAVIPVMKALTANDSDYYADIVQINSKSGLEGSNKNFAYSGAKFGGIGLTQSFALELAPYRIKVNSVCPGNYLDGPLWSDPEKGLFLQYLRAGKVPGAKTVEDVREYYLGKVPMHKGCNPEDVTKAILYAVEQTGETGQAIPVSGGQVMLS